MKTATENGLEELKKILIHRLDSEYAPWIVKNADKEIWKHSPLLLSEKKYNSGKNNHPDNLHISSLFHLYF